MFNLYNQHMGGVDVCDFLMAQYRIQLRTTKWYRHIFYYLLNISVINGWIVYRRDLETAGIPQKNRLSLLTFQSQIAESLLKGGKILPSNSRKRGRPREAKDALPCTNIQGA
jgi:hypothetical protein